MNLRLEQDKVKTDNKVKNNNARCIYCRKCLNSGVCMMTWSDFNHGKKKAGSKLVELGVSYKQ